MASASPEKKKSAKAEGSEKYPPTSQLMVEALKQTEDKNGLSVRGIQAYVGRTFPELLDRPGFRWRLKKSVLKGLESGTLKRPKKSQDSPGVTGYFKLANKAKTEEKVKKPKAKSSPTKTTKARVKPKADQTKSVKARSRSRSTSPKLKASKPTKKTAASPKAKKATPKKSSAGEKKTTAKKATTKKVTTAKTAAKKPTKPKPKSSA